MRKTLASRVNVIQAASIAGVNPDDLLIELNKAIKKDFYMSDTNSNTDNIESLNDNKPDELKLISEDKIIELDVRPILEQGKDPFNDIMSKIRTLKQDEILLLINSFEPIPLYSVLGNKDLTTIQINPLMYSKFTSSERRETLNKWKINFLIRLKVN